MPTPGRIPISARKPVSCGTVIWRHGGALQVTVVVKATFGMVHEGAARLVAPAPLVAEDRYRAGSLAEPHDLAPYLPSAGVILSGSARSSEPVPAMTVRLAVYRDRPLVDKVLHVFGDRGSGAAGPAPFTQMPIVWERAFGGPSVPDNPVGTGASPDGRAAPNILDPADRRRPGGFGPVSSRWGSRRRLLAGHGAPALDEPGEEIAAGFEFRWFQAAPIDQQCDHLRGDEWVVLDGMTAEPRLQTRLPSVRAQARWASSARRGPAREVELAADTLLIDAERKVCSLVWRGRFAVASPEILASLQIFTGVEMPGYLIDWPEGVRDAEPAEPQLEIERDDPGERAPTEKIRVSRVKAPVLPFTAAEPAPPIEDLVPDSMASTVTSPVISPFAQPALPFKPEGARAIEDAHTTALDLAAPALADAAAPFALPRPGETSGARAPSLSGTPWGAEPVPIVEVAAPGAVTVALRIDPARLPPLPAIPEPPPIAPPAIVPPPVPPAIVAAPVIAPPPMVAPAIVAEPAIVAPVAAPRPPSEPPAIAATPLPTPPPQPPRRALTPAQEKALAALTAGSPVEGADLSFADLSGRDLRGLSLDGADLHGADLGSAKLSRASLREVDLSSATLDGADLAGADLTSAKLDQASLRGARAEGATWDRASLRGAIFADASLAEASFQRASCDGASFAGADLGAAKLMRVEGEGVDFTAARLDGASLRKAVLPAANLERASLRDASLEKADLSRARLGAADLAGASLRGAVLADAVLARADVEGADLRDADLSRANVFGVALDRARTTGAKTKDMTDASPDEARRGEDRG